MDDFTGSALAEAEEEREKHPTFVAPFALNSRGEWVQTTKGVSYALDWLQQFGCNAAVVTNKEKMQCYFMFVIKLSISYCRPW